MLASLPVVYNGDKMVEGMRPVLAFMRGRGWNADYYLNEKQASDTLAFEALVEEKLHPAIVRNVGCTNSVEMGRWVCGPMCVSMDIQNSLERHVHVAYFRVGEVSVHALDMCYVHGLIAWVRDGHLGYF